MSPSSKAPLSDDALMDAAIGEALQAADQGEVPVGAILVDGTGMLLAKDRNRIIERCDPTAHAEILVLRAAAKKIGNERLVGTALFVTLEPCAMCAGAISLARVRRLVFAAADPKNGAVLNGPRFFEQATCHHQPIVSQAGDASRASELLKAFFRARRL